MRTSPSPIVETAIVRVYPSTRQVIPANLIVTGPTQIVWQIENSDGTIRFDADSISISPASSNFGPATLGPDGFSLSIHDACLRSYPYFFTYAVRFQGEKWDIDPSIDNEPYGWGGTDAFLPASQDAGWPAPISAAAPR